MTDRPFKVALRWWGDRVARRSAVSELRPSRWLRSSADQGADPAATSRPGFARGPAGTTNYASGGCTAVPALRANMEAEWTPQLMHVLDIDAVSLPVLWDADFLYGPHTTTGDDTYVLCEIRCQLGNPISRAGSVRGRSHHIGPAPGRAGAYRVIQGRPLWRNARPA
jgi:hypothetical protein